MSDRTKGGGVGVPGLTMNDGPSVPNSGSASIRSIRRRLARPWARWQPAIDISMAYGNEAGVRQAVRELGWSVFVTTKYFKPRRSLSAWGDAPTGA